MAVTVFQASRVQEIVSARRVHWTVDSGRRFSGSIRAIVGRDDLERATVVVTRDDPPNPNTTIPLLALCDMLNNGEAATTREQ